MDITQGFARLVAAAKTRIHECSVEELAGLQAAATPVVIDVREPAEFAAGHVPGAYSMPRGVLELKLPELTADPNALVVLYCGSGGRSALAADSLQNMGYQQVLSLAGGFQAWGAAGQDIHLD